MLKVIVKANKYNIFIKFLIANPQIKVILEIGFNTGISSAYFLSSRDDIKVISVDIGIHKYVNDCKLLIDKHFPGRHTLLIGDSKVVIPLLNKKDIKLSPDLIYIDGDHSEPSPLIDARNCIAIARPDTLLVMDDTNLINGWNGVLQAMCTLVQNKEIDLNWVVCENFGKHSWTLFKKTH
jgi:predicted O-methyltransferase YrrM